MYLMIESEKHVMQNPKELNKDGQLHHEIFKCTKNNYFHILPMDDLINFL